MAQRGTLSYGAVGGMSIAEHVVAGHPRPGESLSDRSIYRRYVRARAALFCQKSGSALVDRQQLIRSR
jgi:hypothetical protein